MSVFTSRVTETIRIPHDPEQTVTIRKLAPRQLDAAAKEQQRQALAAVKEIGSALFKEIQALGGDTVKDAKVADPLVGYDRVTLIEKGVTTWTYPDPLARESFEDLDDAAQDFLARAILRLSRPSLFQTDEEREAAKVKG